MSENQDPTTKQTKLNSNDNSDQNEINHEMTFQQLQLFLKKEQNITINTNFTHLNLSYLSPDIKYQNFVTTEIKAIMRRHCVFFDPYIFTGKSYFLMNDTVQTNNMKDIKDQKKETKIINTFYDLLNDLLNSSQYKRKMKIINNELYLTITIPINSRGQNDVVRFEDFIFSFPTCQNKGDIPINGKYMLLANTYENGNPYSLTNSISIRFGISNNKPTFEAIYPVVLDGEPSFKLNHMDDHPIEEQKQKNDTTLLKFIEEVNVNQSSQNNLYTAMLKQTVIKINTLTHDIYQLKAQNDEAFSELETQLKTKTDELKTETDELKTKIDELADELKTKIDELETKISQLPEKINAQNKILSEKLNQEPKEDTSCLHMLTTLLYLITFILIFFKGGRLYPLIVLEI